MKKSHKEAFNPKINYVGSDALPIRFPSVIFNGVDINYFAYLHDGDFANINNRFKHSNREFLDRMLDENDKVKETLLKSFGYTYFHTYKERARVTYRIFKILSKHYANVGIAHFLYSCVQFGGVFYKIARMFKVINNAIKLNKKNRK